MDYVLTILLPMVRDVAIVVLAAETIIIGAITGVVLVQVWKLVSAVRRNLDRLVNQASEVLSTSADTVRSVKGTTSFVSERAAQPVIEVLSVISAASQFARTAFSQGNGNGKRGDH